MAGIALSKRLSKFYTAKTKDCASPFFSRSRSPYLSLLSLFSVIFGLIGLIKTLVWPSSSEIAVDFIGHVFKKSAILKRQYIFTCLQKQDKLLKYKSKVNVYQEHNSNISCCRSIFNQNIFRVRKFHFHR